MNVSKPIAGIHLNSNETYYPEIYREILWSLMLIEGLVVLIAILLVFLVVFGSFRRRCRKSWQVGLITSAYSFSTFLIICCFPNLQSSSYRNEFLIIWLVFLVIALENVDSIFCCNFEDDDRSKVISTLQDLQLFFFLGLLWDSFRKSHFMVPLAILIHLVLLIRRVGERTRALKWASKSYGFRESCKLVADFMVNEETLSNENEVNATTMVGYNYLLKGNSEDLDRPSYLHKLNLNDNKVITVEKVWQCRGRLLRNNNAQSRRLKDLSLSYALHRLLLRRFAGYELAEINANKTWNFVRNGLLSDDNDVDRAFRVIEVELSFLFDCFYTRYPIMFSSFKRPLFRLYNLILFTVASCMIASKLTNYQKPPGDVNLVTENGLNLDVIVIRIVIIVLPLVELAQFLHICCCNWMKVKFLCCYVQRDSWQNNKYLEKLTEIACCQIPSSIWCFKPWVRKLGQYCLITCFDYDPSKWFYNGFTQELINSPRKGQKQVGDVYLTRKVKKAIIGTLKNGKELRNGIASLGANGVSQLSWACRLTTQTHVILVWHIATSLCEVAASNRREWDKSTEERLKVATTLSKYCAYLLAFKPKLLPGHAYTTEFIFDQVVGEARNALKGRWNMEKKYKEMKKFTDQPPSQEGTIIKLGAMLCKQILELDEGLQWKVLADFWAEMMLFVAPSDDANAHAKYLAEGGEFVTHLWALLTHAGILNRTTASHFEDP